VVPVRERQPPGGGRFDEAGDATRRTRLANERTYLAWWRTGLTAFAVSIGSGKLVPALASGVSLPYTAIGIGFAIVGVFCSGYAFWRSREVEEAVNARSLLTRTSASWPCSLASAPRSESS
jgi:inner membrane protein YidH